MASSLLLRGFLVALCLSLVAAIAIPNEKVSEYEAFEKTVHEFYAPFMNASSLEKFTPLLYNNALIWAEDAKKTPEREEPLIYFDCETFGPTPGGPSSVHALRPGDIDVVMAMGDSITAGFGALSNNIFQIFTEYRGVSWSIGGDENVSSVLTVPNAFKRYNPNVVGFSVGTGKANTANAALDQAVSGAIGQSKLKP